MSPTKKIFHWYEPTEVYICSAWWLAGIGFQNMRDIIMQLKPWHIYIVQINCTGYRQIQNLYKCVGRVKILSFMLFVRRHSYQCMLQFRFSAKNNNLLMQGQYGTKIQFRLSSIIINPLHWTWNGVYWFHLLRPSARPSVRPSVCGRNDTQPVSCAMLDGFISFDTSYQPIWEGVSRVLFFHYFNREI